MTESLTFKYRSKNIDAPQNSEIYISTPTISKKYDAPKATVLKNFKKKQSSQKFLCSYRVIKAASREIKT